MVQVEGSDLFDYTETEKGELIDSVKHLPKYNGDIDFIADLTFRVLNHSIEEQTFISESAEKHAKLNREIMLAIDALANALTAEMQAFAEDFKTSSFVSEVAGLAKVPLETIYDAAQVQAGQFHCLMGLGVVDRLVAEPLKAGPNAKPFQQKFLHHVAHWWTEFGGRIGIEGGKYERYFNAAVRPVFANAKLRQLTNVDLTNTLFTRHVSTFMKKNSVRPKRGRPRNSTFDA